MKTVVLFVVAALYVVWQGAGEAGGDERSFGVSYRESAAEAPGARAAAQPAAQPQAIIGDDEREPILSSDLYPFRAIAYLELTTASGGASCTGTFVGEDVLLTAAHCLWSFEDGFTDSIRVAPAKDGLSEPYGSEFAFDWVVPQEWIDSEASDTLWDFGIIVMEDGTLGSSVGWLQVANMTTATLSRSDFTPAIIGYPGDIGNGDTMWGASKDSFTDVQDFILEYDIDTAPGQSGSAIISVNLQEFFLGYVVGIHTTGGTSANHGSRIDEELLDRLIGMCGEFGCSLDAYTETVGEQQFFGDVDCGGAFNIGDAINTARHLVSLPVNYAEGCPEMGTQANVDGTARTWGDTDCGGAVNIGDAINIARKLVSLPVNQQVGCPVLGSQVTVEQ